MQSYTPWQANLQRDLCQASFMCTREAMPLQRPMNFLQVVPKKSHNYNNITEESYSTKVEEKHDIKSPVVKEELTVKVVLKTNEVF